MEGTLRRASDPHSSSGVVSNRSEVTVTCPRSFVSPHPNRGECIYWGKAVATQATSTKSRQHRAGHLAPADEKNKK